MNSTPNLDNAVVDEAVRRALAEDLGEPSAGGDITSKRIVRIDQPARARILAKASGTLAGGPVAEAAFHAIDKTVNVEWRAKEGAPLVPGKVIAEISGRGRAILAAERTALNFLQHLSGVATLTAEFVQRCSKHGVRVLCTRKTLPGLRSLQRYAVTVGGAGLHRAGLFDAILIKTNHERLAGGVGEAVRRTKANPNLEVEVEVTNLKELDEAVKAGADRILLDNADLRTIAKAVTRTRDRIFLEISGGIDLKKVEAIAKLGPDAISIGRLTHSAPAIDMSIEILGPAGAAPTKSSS